MAISSCTPQKNAGGLIGVTVPEFNLESYEKPGTFATPATFKGKVLLLTFFNTTSEPCREAMPFLDDLYSTYREKGLEVAAITIEDRADIDAFKLQARYDYPIFLDKGASFVEAMRIYAIPSVVVVSRDGIVQFEGHPNEQNLILEAIQASLEQ